MTIEPTGRDMDGSGSIDITFDFRSDTPPWKDPDALSPTLRKYHKLLWSKPLPSGVMFELVDTTPGVYLHHHSRLGEFWLASDSVIPTFRYEPRLSHVFEQIPEELEDLDFNSPAVPNNMAAYLAYRELAIGFIEARNQRIRAWWTMHRAG